MAATLEHCARRGDLSRSPFRDLFAELAQASATTRLRVWDAVEQYHLYFRNGEVQLWSPERPTRRLGQRLVLRGWLREADLMRALQAQKAEDRPLGELLIEHGFVTQEQVDETAHHQLSEDLYALFMWKQGDFEIDEPQTEERTEARLAVLPRFRCRYVMEEAKQRAGEWEILQRRIYSVDEMFVARTNCDLSRLDDRQRRVFDVLDGRKTVRQVSDATMLSLYECACTLRDLLEMQCIDLANAVDTLQTAASCIQRGEHSKARTILQSLMERPGEINQDMMLEAADLLRRCGASRLAADAKLLAARIGGHSESALDLAREACRENPRSVRAWAHLRHELIDRRVGGEELQEVSVSLIDALLGDRRPQDALRILDELDALAVPDLSLLQRRVVALHKLGRVEEEIDVLDELAVIFEREGDTEQLEKVYRQILRLNRNRRDIARALADLQPGVVGTALRKLRGFGTAARGLFGRRHEDDDADFDEYEDEYDDHYGRR